MTASTTRTVPLPPGLIIAPPLPDLMLPVKIRHGVLGFLRGHQMSVETTIRNLEDDTYSNGPDLNTQIAVLNKINATAVTSARLAKDANNVLVSLLEQQLLGAADRRDAVVQGINAHIAFMNEAGALLARTTARTTDALTTFRIP